MKHKAGVLTSDLTISLVNHMVGLVLARKSVSFQMEHSSKKERKAKKKNLLFAFLEVLIILFLKKLK